MEITQAIIYGIFGAASIAMLINLIALSDSFGMRALPEPRVPPFVEKEDSITFVGHSTALIRVNETNILTDPVFGNWLIIVMRPRAAGMNIESLPKIDAILISHAHRDHLDKWSMEQFPKDTPVLISRGNGDILRGWGFTDVRELEAWNGTAIKSVKIAAVPAKHSGARNSAFADYPKALGYVIEGGKTVYFAGDSGMFDGFAEIGKRYKIDAALLPIGAHMPRWFMKRHHIGPQDAIDAMKQLGAKEMIPIHWGSFRIALESPREPKQLLEALAGDSGLETRIHILENGEKYILK